jgi:alkylation response protein AidB-like acyl-CoA dehydrogenase
MISFSPTEEQEVVRDTLRDFASSVLRPAARDCDEAGSLDEDVVAKAWELGLVATQIPEAFGGAGEPRSPVTNALVLEELAVGDAALALAVTAPASFAFPIVDLGSDEQRRRYLPQLCGSAFHAASLAVMEPSPVFDPSVLRTKAEPKGDRFVLSGRKCFVPLADRASHFLVLARGPQVNEGRPGEGPAGLDAFIVPRDAAGLSIEGPEKNLGLRGLPTGSLVLERVEVPVEDRLGGPAGCDVRRVLDLSRTALAALQVGLSRAVLEYAVPYAKERRAFGQAIAQKQAIAFALADMRIETDAARWLTWKAASQLEQGQGASRSAWFAWTYAAQHAMRIADDGVQVLGGHGFIREHPVEMWYRHARTLGVLEGVGCV